MASLVFCGTSDFALPILVALAKHHDIIRVFSQMDKPVGRGGKVQMTPVKALCDKLSIPCSQPDKIQNDPFWDNPPPFDFLITASFGQILPEKILKVPKRDSLNVHASLLPKYRGASPIQCALLNGDHVTGVSIIRMVKKMDAGAVFLRQELEIEPTDTSITLFEKLSNIGARLILTTLETYNAIVPEEQNEANVTTCAKITREDGEIDWHESAEKIINCWRAFQPWPGMYTFWKGKRLKLLDIAKRDLHSPETPGKVFETKNGIRVATSDGAIEIHTLQLEGKSASPIAAFATGYRDFVGSVLQ